MPLSPEALAEQRQLITSYVNMACPVGTISTNPGSNRGGAGALAQYFVNFETAQRTALSQNYRLSAQDIQALNTLGQTNPQLREALRRAYPDLGVQPNNAWGAQQGLNPAQNPDHAMIVNALVEGRLATERSRIVETYLQGAGSNNSTSVQMNNGDSMNMMTSVMGGNMMGAFTGFISRIPFVGDAMLTIGTVVGSLINKVLAMFGLADPAPIVGFGEAWNTVQMSKRVAGGAQTLSQIPGVNGQAVAAELQQLANYNPMASATPIPDSLRADVAGLRQALTGVQAGTSNPQTVRNDAQVMLTALQGGAIPGIPTTINNQPVRHMLVTLPGNRLGIASGIYVDGKLTPTYFSMVNAGGQLQSTTLLPTNARPITIAQGPNFGGGQQQQQQQQQPPPIIVPVVALTAQNATDIRAAATAANGQIFTGGPAPAIANNNAIPPNIRAALAQIPALNATTTPPPQFILVNDAVTGNTQILIGRTTTMPANNFDVTTVLSMSSTGQVTDVTASSPIMRNNTIILGGGPNGTDLQVPSRALALVPGSTPPRLVDTEYQSVSGQPTITANAALAAALAPPNGEAAGPASGAAAINILYNQWFTRARSESSGEGLNLTDEQASRLADAVATAYSNENRNRPVDQVINDIMTNGGIVAGQNGFSARQVTAISAALTQAHPGTLAAINQRNGGTSAIAWLQIPKAAADVAASDLPDAAKDRLNGLLTDENARWLVTQPNEDGVRTVMTGTWNSGTFTVTGMFTVNADNTVGSNIDLGSTAETARQLPVPVGGVSNAALARFFESRAIVTARLLTMGNESDQREELNTSFRQFLTDDGASGARQALAGGAGNDLVWQHYLTWLGGTAGVDSTLYQYANAQAGNVELLEQLGSQARTALAAPPAPPAPVVTNPLQGATMLPGSLSANVGAQGLTDLSNFLEVSGRADGATIIQALSGDTTALGTQTTMMRHMLVSLPNGSTAIVSGDYNDTSRQITPRFMHTVGENGQLTPVALPTGSGSASPIPVVSLLGQNPLGDSVAFLTPDRLQAAENLLSQRYPNSGNTAPANGSTAAAIEVPSVPNMGGARSLA